MHNLKVKLGISCAFDVIQKKTKGADFEQKRRKDSVRDDCTHCLPFDILSQHVSHWKAN